MRTLQRINPWVLLGIAILGEVAGFTALKASQGFSRPFPLIIVAVGYLIAVSLIGSILERLPLGVVYAVWGGGGTVLTTVVGLLAYGETMSLLQISGLVCAVSGVMVLNLTTRNRR
jgi:small multidrug resistance pump